MPRSLADLAGLQRCLVDTGNDFRRDRMCERGSLRLLRVGVDWSGARSGYPAAIPWHQVGKRLPPIQVARSGIEVVDTLVPDLCQVNDNTRRFGLMRSQLRKVCIAPISNAYDLSVLSFHSWKFKQLQDVEAPGIEKESMMPKQFAELCDCRMVLGKHLCSKLSKGLAYLGLT